MFGQLKRSPIQSSQSAVPIEFGFHLSIFGYGQLEMSAHRGNEGLERAYVSESEYARKMECIFLSQTFVICLKTSVTFKLTINLIPI